jgi:hypothetical protein
MALGAVITLVGAGLVLHSHYAWALAGIVAALVGIVEALRVEPGVPVTVDFLESRLRVEPDGTVLYLCAGQWIVLHPERVE